MELVLLVLAVVGTGVVTFWLTGSVYGLLRTPAVYFPVSLAFRMTVVAIAGTVLIGLGGIIGGMLVFMFEFRKRPDYSQVRCLVAGGIISVLGVAAMFLVGFGLAWQM